MKLVFQRVESVSVDAFHVGSGDVGMRVFLLHDIVDGERIELPAPHHHHLALVLGPVASPPNMSLRDLSHG